MRDEPPDLRTAIMAAIDSVKPGARGQPVTEVEARLTQALREQEAYLPPGDVRLIARAMADPWWSFKHPVAAFREIRRRRQYLDPDENRLAKESAYLDSRLDQILEIVQRRSRLTVDGTVHFVVISPWSAEVAAQIHQLAAPIRVNVDGINGTNPDSPAGDTP